MSAVKRRTRTSRKQGKQVAALAIEDVEIDTHCTGNRWTAADMNVLARIIAIIAMGQAAHAARIIGELLDPDPAIDDNALRADARRAFSIRGSTDAQREVSRYHRDGFMFEAISWAAAQQATAGKALLRDPHVKSTTQGLDGLMIEVEKDRRRGGRRMALNPDRRYL